MIEIINGTYKHFNFPVGEHQVRVGCKDNIVGIKFLKGIEYETYSSI